MKENILLGTAAVAAVLFGVGTILKRFHTSFIDF